MRVAAAITVSLALFNECLYVLQGYRLALPRVAFTGGPSSIVTYIAKV